MKEREGKTGKEWGEMTDKKTQMASCRGDFVFNVGSYIGITETNSVCRQTEMKLTQRSNLALKT